MKKFLHFRAFIEKVLAYHTETLPHIRFLTVGQINDKLKKKYGKWRILCILYKSTDTRNVALKSITKKVICKKVLGVG